MNVTKVGDSRELLEELEDKTVNVVYLDPPFNSNRKYRLTSSNDSVGFDDIFSTDSEYVELVSPIVKE